MEMGPWFSKLPTVVEAAIKHTQIFNSNYSLSELFRGYWYVYNATHDEDGNFFVHPQVFHFDSNFVGAPKLTSRSFLSNPARKFVYTSNTITKDRDQTIIVLRGNDEKAILRVKTPATVTTSHVHGLWIGYAFDGRPCAGHVTLRRVPEPHLINSLDSVTRDHATEKALEAQWATHGADAKPPLTLRQK